MKLAPKSGVAIAAAAAALIMSGATIAPVHATEDKVPCFGANSCKGHGACKTAKNECKGLNECKGMGFVELTKAECEEAGGSTTDPNA